MKTLIKISMMVAVFSVCAAFAAETYSPLRARVDTSAVLLGKEASFARLVRITMKDGSVEEFLVESVKTLTFQANPNDSSNIYDDDEEEDPERSDEPDRTPEQQSSGSVTPSSSSVTPIPDSSSDDGKTPSSDSKRGGDDSSSSVTPSSSSETPSAIPNNITYAGTRLGWNSRNQTLSVFSRQGGDARFTVLDVQGVVIGKGNLYVSRGVTSISLDYLDLPKGNFVIKLEIGNTKLQQTIAVTGK
ncbi:hypothetical protein [Fibrobacter sp.]|uniref:hypothetical protein n=1 Tax=Fibrobacter sp. TaxID=35828 RepID=UPI00388CF8B4